MKKTYIIPTVEIVTLKTQQQMMAGSEFDTNRSFGDGEGITIGSRGGSSWDDDDDY